jgi:hypothetical protein
MRAEMRPAIADYADYARASQEPAGAPRAMSARTWSPSLHRVSPTAIPAGRPPGSPLGARSPRPASPAKGPLPTTAAAAAPGACSRLISEVEAYALAPTRPSFPTYAGAAALVALASAFALVPALGQARDAANDFADSMVRAHNNSSTPPARRRSTPGAHAVVHRAPPSRHAGSS